MRMIRNLEYHYAEGRLAFGFDPDNWICAGFHIHHKALAIDFFGFYLNYDWGTDD